MTWHYRPFGVLDFEATGVDPFTARPVSFCYAVIDSEGKDLASLEEVVDCGVEVPADAAAVHGLTTELVRERGVPPSVAFPPLIRALTAAQRQGLPLCIMNAGYDWTLLRAEGQRLEMAIPELALLDPSLLDKGMDRYRKGKRRLTELCQHYGIPLTDAHTARADAVATAQLTRAIIRKHPRLSGATSAAALAPWQERVWEEYRSFLCSDGRKKISKGWPIPESPE